MLSGHPRVYPELFAVVGSKVPDLRGLFLRGQGGNAAPLGTVQGDAIRNIWGDIYTISPTGYQTGAWYVSQNLMPGRGAPWKQNNYPWGELITTFDASRVVPTAPENRPINCAVRYFIRARF